MRAFDLVIFDCDGVVVDSEQLSCQCLADVLTRHGLPTDIDEVYARFLGRGSSAVDEHYRNAVGKPLPETFRDDYRRQLEASFRASLQPMPHVLEVLDRLESPFCLASSSDPDRVRFTLSVTYLEAMFGDRVFNAAMVGKSKPAPDLFLLAAERMAAAPRRTLVVEDSEIGVAAGKAAGMTVWGFVGGSHCRQPDSARRLTEAGADRILRSMKEFPL